MSLCPSASGQIHWEEAPFLLIGSPLKVWLSAKGFSSDDTVTVFIIANALSLGFSQQGYLTHHIFKTKTMFF